MWDTTKPAKIHVKVEPEREEREIKEHKNAKKCNGRILPKLEAQQIPSKIYAKRSTSTHQNKNDDSQSQTEIFVSSKRTMIHTHKRTLIRSTPFFS